MLPITREFFLNTVCFPDDSTAPAAKPKRRPYLLKRKALTTSFFDTGRKDDKEKGEPKLNSNPEGN
jgi:hypothetical protein